MIAGVNDTPAAARELLEKMRGLPAHFNLIPLNRVEESPLKPSTRWRSSREYWSRAASLPRSAGPWAETLTPPAAS